MSRGERGGTKSRTLLINTSTLPTKYDILSLTWIQTAAPVDVSAASWQTFVKPQVLTDP